VKQRPGISPAVAAVTILAIAMFFYTAFTADPDRFGRVWPELAFELAAWAACMLVAVRRSPSGTLRISDPVVLTLCLGGLYLIYPSIAWSQGQRLPFDVQITPETASVLFALHALFFVGFTAGYAFSARRTQGEVSVDIRRLPAPWILFIVPMLPLAVVTVLRLSRGEGLLSSATYGEQWFAAQAQIKAARDSGGVQYLIYQIQSKTWFLPIIAQGVAGGLLFAQALKRSRAAAMRILALICVSAAAMLLLGDGGRSPVIVYVLIALVFSDIVAGPLPWKMIAPVAASGLAFFLLLGYVRAYRNYGFEEAVQIAFYMYERDSGSDVAAEFTSMLPKEAITVNLVDREGREGPMYLVRSALSLLPSQWLPGKMEWTQTNDLISRELLGSRTADLGAGVAGTSVGDGYRFAGPLGVFLSAALFGLVFGRVRTWGLSLGTANPIVLLKIALMAGLTGFTYLLIRSSLSEVLTFLVYAVVLPWIGFSAVLKRNHHWLGRLPIIAQHRRLPGRNQPHTCLGHFAK
jgi:hypothetical protein